MASLAVLAQSPLLRAGLAALLSTMGFDPVEEAADLEDLKCRANDVRRPDLFLISLQQRNEQLDALTQEIKAWEPNAKVLFLTPALDIQALSACFGAGAAGYLLENISPDGLEHSLRLAVTGECVFPSELATVLSTSASKGSAPIKVVDELRNLDVGKQEIDILQCVANGETRSFLAKELGISEDEVGAHIKNILRKLRVSYRAQSALWGIARGLAAPFAQLAQTLEGEDGQLKLQNSPGTEKQ